MLTIISIFLLISGFFAALAKVRKNTQPSQFIAVYILGLCTIILSKEHVFSGDNINHTLILLLISILSVNFALGEILKGKSNKLLFLIPVLSSFSLLLYPGLSEHHYLEYHFDDHITILIIALLSSSAPILMHGFQVIVKKLAVRFKIATWSTTDSHLLESALAYLFIAGIAAIGNFLLGPMSILITATFFLSSSFIVRQRLSISPSILLSTSGALFLISAAIIILHKTGFHSINLTNGEVLQGIFIAGFLALSYELLIRIGQRNKGKTQVIFTIAAIIIPALAIVVVGLLYTQLERLGGLLSLTAMLISLGVLSLLYSSLKTASNFIGLKLTALGLVIFLIPFISPVQHSSGINLEDLGISLGDGKDQSSSSELTYFQKLEIPNGQDLSEATGNWKINEEASKIFFELGPKGGRTKGEFRAISGTVKVKESIESSTIQVSIPVKKLTTFNPIRNADLINEAEFFNSSKFPVITFNSKTITPNNDAYEVKGDFTMKGITKEVSVELKLLGVGERDGKKVGVLWGFASIDRTEYDMEPSAKIGNIVDFHFEVQLEQE